MTPTTYIDCYCSLCGFQHETTRPYCCHPCQCPGCGKDTIQHGFRVLPTNQVRRDKEPKRYDLLSGEKEIQVYLQAATGERCGVTMRPEYAPDCNDDPIAVAKVALTILETKYLSCSAIGRVRAEVSAMEKCAELSEQNARSNRINELRKSIVCDIAEYENLCEELETVKQKGE